MKINQFLFFPFLWIFIFSCKKDSASLNIDYPSNYHKSGIKPNGNLRVFSSTGEIRDQSVISRFNETNSSSFSAVADVIGNHPGKMDSVKFSDAQHASMNNNYIPLNCLVSQESATIILTRTDTSLGSTYLNELTHDIYYYIGQVKPDVYAEYLISSTRGDFYFGYSAREKFILNLSGSQIVAPLVQYNLYLAGLNNGTYFNGYVNNNLQNDFYKNMNAGDTVTLREYLVTYEK